MTQTPKPTDLINRSKINGYKDSAHSGDRLKSSSISMSIWRSNNEGYLYGSSLRNCQDYQLAKRYIQEKRFLGNNKYSHGDDCYYKKNYCHIEVRGGHRYLRPSEWSKFVLKDGKTHFTSNRFQYAYHGTHPRNVKSILDNGLVPSGTTLNNGVRINSAHGNAHGRGVYTSKVPLYAQLYADPERWGNYWVQTSFLLRQDPNTITAYGVEAGYTKWILGDRSKKFHKLYGGLIKEDEIQFKTTRHQTIVIQALLVKIHRRNPSSPGGEYHDIVRLLDTVTSNRN